MFSADLKRRERPQNSGDEQNVHAALQVAEQHYVMDRGRVIGRFSSEELLADEELRLRFLGVSARL